MQESDGEGRATRAVASRVRSSTALVASTFSEPSTKRTDDVGPPAGSDLVAHALPARGDLLVAPRPLGREWPADRGASRSSTDTSRSPKSTMAAVRGIGVAVMTRRSGSARRDRSRAALVAQHRALLDAEAVLFVDDDETERAKAHVLAQAARACPRRCRRAPCAVRRAPPGDPSRCTRPVRSCTDNGAFAAQDASRRSRSSPRKSRRSEARCCSASTSVGAMRTLCRPPSSDGEHGGRARRWSCPNRRRPEEPVHRQRAPPCRRRSRPSTRRCAAVKA